MPLTALPVNSPLTQLRAQGLQAEFNRARIIVYPRPKITNTIRQFVVDNLESIVNELNLEGYYTKNPDTLGYLAKSYGDERRNQGYLIWSLNDTTCRIRCEPRLALDRLILPSMMNGNLAI